EITIGKHKLSDDLLFTHIGIGGPAAYRASLYDLHNGLTLNLLPNIDLNNVLMQAKQTFGNKTVTRLLSEHMPTRIAKYITKNDSRNIADIKNTEIEQIVSRITNIHISADNLKLHSMASAEVVLGGISTDNISSKTMESLLCPGLYFTGEVIDITGDLGGFNLHWAWASGFVAGKNA
ncbi:MAG: NAD(P)/FAD-dependent oxidoreductase, partial [Alphaproteobacteria bacterium]|nr:NAD(P)/FAD-dependent oxidoreductase [Alphaproteobacteria bacterium]